MSRMADRITTGIVEPPAWQSADWAPDARAKMQRELSRQVQQVPIIVADNVCEYLYAGTDQEEWHPKADFPTLAPPFPLFWLEMRRPSRIVSCETGEMSARTLPYAWGYFCQAIEPRDVIATLTEEFIHGDTSNLRRQVEGSFQLLGPTLEQKFEAAAGDRDRFWKSLTDGEQAFIANASLLQEMMSGKQGRWMEELRALSQQESIRWVMRMDLWIEAEKGWILGPLVNHTCLLNAHGELLTDPLFHLYMTDGAIPHVTIIQPAIDAYSTLVFAAYLTLSFFHCKNVSVSHETPPTKLSKAHIRRHGVPLLRYHRLDIHPMQQVLRSEGRSGDHGLAKALHICRGHFKDYRQNGLFGRNFGIYWWDMHLRGKAEQGIVMKDYAMHPA